MLALAKVEQLRQQGDALVADWAGVVRAVALDLAPLIAEHRLDFSLDTVAARVRAHEWTLRELVRNRLGLAICHEIVVSLGGSISLENRALHAHVRGLDATVSLPLADNPPR